MSNATTSDTTNSTASSTTHAIHWFEIPAANLERAQRFYELLLATPMRRESMGPHELAIFDYAPESGVGGCLMTGDESMRPGAEGTLIYLAAEPSLDAVLQRVEGAGGRIVKPKVTLPGDMGVFAHIIDSEGNRIGLHAQA